MVTGEHSKKRAFPSLSKELSETLPNSYKFLSMKRKASQNKLLDQAPKYRPWSAPDFLERLDTYSYRIWDIPEDLTEINPVQCSRKGWKCVAVGSKNMLKCVFCGKLLQVNIGTDDNLFKLLEEKYAQLLIEGHKHSCPWKEKSCGAEIYAIDNRNLHATVKSSYDTLKETANIASNSEEDKNPIEPVKLEQIAKILGITTPVNYAALTLALQGWKLESGSIGKCTMCFAVSDLSDISPSHHRQYCPYHDNCLGASINFPAYSKTYTKESAVKDRLTRMRKVFSSAN